MVYLKKAAAIASLAYSEIIQEIKPGKTEAEIFEKIRMILKKNGSQKEPFDFVVASGFRTVNPHAIPSGKVIQEGEPIVLDFGATFKGFCSDMTRTVCLGEAPSKLKLVYEVVREAQAKAIEALKPGKTCQEIDAVAREIIDRSGYAETFIHGLGHGIGFEVHEAPTINQRAKDILRPGMCLTIEPGIYLAGWGGVRLEDMVIVTKTGAEVITFAAKELELK